VDDVERLFDDHRPAYVFLVAGKSGGITANQRRPAELMLDNLLVESLILSAAHRHGVQKLLYLASACCYPKHAEQPMRVESLMTGPLEPTSEAYALAKLAGITLCAAMRREHGDRFISAIPANIFGPGDDFSPEDSHVVAALIRRMHDAKALGQPSLDIWGTGHPRREFLFVDDVADACVFLMDHYDEDAPINIGGGVDLSIRELAEIIQGVTGYQGRLRFDETKPDGMPRKVLDSAPLLARGWRPRMDVRGAVKATYESFLAAQGKRPADARTAV
jgi:GDP-L-fucose synthase